MFFFQSEKKKTYPMASLERNGDAGQIVWGCVA